MRSPKIREYQKGGDEWVINIFLLDSMYKEWSGKKLPTKRKSGNVKRDKTGPKKSLFFIIFY